MHVDLNSFAKLVVSIDVEDWPQSTWDHSLEISDRAVRNTERVLNILAKYRKTVTMFVLGKFAERFPDTVKNILSAGHEVACHGYGHIEIFRQTPDEFRQDAQRAKGFLEDLLGVPVLGYRAPDFSVVSSTLWALDTLSELGFQYDSSVFPTKQKRYGIGGWPTCPVRVRLRSGREIVQLPISVACVFGRRFGVAGGGYHRLLPWTMIRLVIARKLRRGEPFIAYCHPYEFDPAEFESLQFRVPIRVRLHQGVGRKGFQRKFERMLAHFDMAKASTLLLARDSMPVYQVQTNEEGTRK